ncbi:MAG: tetratricopeptide repeat protein [Phycisphaerales bacterium]
MRTRTLLHVLLGIALFVLWGCEPAPRPATTTSASTTSGVSSDPTEAQLLAQLDAKYENPQAHYELAKLYHKSQNWIKADFHYQRAISFDPAFRAAQAGQIKMFVDRGETAKAEQYANGYIRDTVGSINEMLRLGWEFEQVGLDVYALRCYRQALDAAPDSPEANRQIGFYYLSRNDQAQAKQYLMRSFELNPRQPDVAGALGRLGVVVQAPVQPEPTTTAPK